MIKSIPTPIKVLFIENDYEDMEFFKDGLAEYDSTALFTWIRESNKLGKHLSEISRELYNIIFLDIRMPLKDGKECLKEIRRIKGLNKVPIVMFSTFKFNHDIEDTFLNGANLYVCKPLRFVSYIETFQKIFSHEWEETLLKTDKKKYFLEV